MARTAEFGVFPVFRGLDGHLAVQPEVPFPSEDDAKRAAEVFAGVLGGAVAFSRVTDRATGEVEDGVIIGRYGIMAGDQPDQASDREAPESP
ncbi:MAG: hypothetical protein ACHQAY_23995 [Hyphomicrobiales bacterium]